MLVYGMLIFWTCSYFAMLTTKHLVLVLCQAPVLPLGPWQAPAVLLAQSLHERERERDAGPDSTHTQEIRCQERPMATQEISIRQAAGKELGVKETGHPQPPFSSRSH